MLRHQDGSITLDATEAEAVRKLLAHHSDDCLHDHGLSADQAAACLDIYGALAPS